MTIPDVILKNENYIVVNKPAGMIVNNADTSRAEFTLQDWIEENYKLKTINNKPENSSEFFQRGGIVHRLDKETSGALIVALNEKSFIYLQNQFKERTIKKVYIALCHGKMIEEGEINVPIGRLPWNRMRFGVIPQGREAYTKFRTLKHMLLKEGRVREELSLVEVYPTTGRTHQIRVHFQYAGHPIYADSLYSGRKTYARDRKHLSRHFLHASRITFEDPESEKRVEIVAPLPNDLQSFLDFLPQLT